MRYNYRAIYKNILCNFFKWKPWTRGKVSVAYKDCSEEKIYATLDWKDEVLNFGCLDKDGNNILETVRWIPNHSCSYAVLITSVCETIREAERVVKEYKEKVKTSGY